jgi:hypothetical protein
MSVLFSRFNFQNRGRGRLQEIGLQQPQVNGQNQANNNEQ